MRINVFAPFQSALRVALRSRIVSIAAAAILVAGIAFAASNTQVRAQQPKLIDAPDLVGGVDWFNTDKPIRLEDLRGRIVILDFWTLC
jgi:hypothetical protein